MKCPKCQFENEGGAKFCSSCGFRLELLCAECGKTNKHGSRFCNACGHRFEDVPARGKPISPTESERKYVTVLFSDMSGYTAMTEKLDPEEVKEIMGNVFGKIATVVARYDGFIEKFIGDAVMALFGVPRSHEDDPVRAIRAAREIHDVVASVGPQYAQRIGKPLTMHTGICTGLVVTGEVDVDKGTHGVLGDTINTAARLMGLAKPGEIVTNPDTYHQAEGYFTFEPIKPTVVKGKTEPVRPYKVLSSREEPSKIHRLSGLRAELIGRKVEMAQLQKAVENLKQGKGVIFPIVGDAGTGKSRLIEEFRSTLDLDTIQWCEGHSYAYVQNIPYFPFIDLFSRAWQIEDGDSSETVRKKVEYGITSLLGSEEGMIPYIGTLYSLSYPEIEGTSPEIWKSRLHAGVQSILSALTRRGPTVICLEDLHWADSSSIELLRFILKDFQIPAVFLCAYRPPFSLFTSHQLAGLSKTYTEIALRDLSISEARTMVESLLKTETIPTELWRFIQTRVEGNPFFLEEAINSLIESETLIRDNGRWKLPGRISEAVIPSTVQGIIAARIDRLEREMKRILQEASVIGRTFLYEILTRITDLKNVVDESITGLERLDFIRARTIQPDLEYIFKHALTQEVVYNGLLKTERQNIHEKIGQVMEEFFHNRLPEFYETLAYHYKQGFSIFKAIDYLIKAGEKSFKRYALNEAHSCFKEAYDIVSGKAERTDEDEKLIIELIIKWGYALHMSADFAGLINLFKTREALVELHAGKGQLVMFYGWLGFALGRREILQDGYQYLRKALHIAEEIRDMKAIGYSCAWLSHTCADMNLLEESMIFGERARGIARRFESDQYLFGISFFFSAWAYYLRGDVRMIADLGQALLDYGRKHSDRRCIGFYYTVMAMSRISAGDVPSTIDFCNECIKVSPDPMTSNVTKILLSRCYFTAGRLQEAQSTLVQVIEYSKKFGYEIAGTIAQLWKGMILIAQGDLKQGMGLYENAMLRYSENRQLSFYAVGNFMMGMVYSRIAQGGGEKKNLSFLAKNIGFLVKTLPFAYKKAEEHFNKAITTAREIGAKSLLGQAYLESGKLHMAKGKTEKAYECITEAIEIFEKCEADVFLRQTKETLATLV